MIKKRSFGPDWDEPSPGNEELCRKFEYGEKSDQTMSPYRYFVPETDRKVPLVVYLHGADAFGDDNETHLSMHDIGTVFARESWQRKHPCYILAPQCKAGCHWAYPVHGNKVCMLINDFIVRYPNIDAERIYIYGYSAGGVGIFGLIKAHPDLFAGAVPICGATNWDNIEALQGVPMWLIHAEDDLIVKNSYQALDETDAWLGSEDLYERLKDTHPDIHFTKYPAGHMKEKYGVNPHCSWVPAGENEEVKEWLFACRRK